MKLRKPSLADGVEARRAFFRFSYSLKELLDRETRWPNILKVAGGILALFFLTYLGLWEKGLFMAAVTTAGLFAAKFLIDYIVEGFSNTGGNYILSGKYLVTQKVPLGCDVLDEAIDKTRFELATSFTAKVTGELNAQAYGGGLWEGLVEEKYLRNLDHIERNNFSINLLKSKDGSTYIGYTHVFPVDAEVWASYLRGEIGDNDFNAKMICPSNDLESPYGLIMFAIGQGNYQPDYMGIKDYRREIGDILEQCLVVHFLYYLNGAFKKKRRIQVLFQNYGNHLLSHFRESASINPQPSKDKAPILIFTLNNPLYSDE